jgi:hypothetical protein
MATGYSSSAPLSSERGMAGHSITCHLRALQIRSRLRNSELRNTHQHLRQHREQSAGSRSPTS